MEFFRVLKKSVRRMNDAFISAVLAVFYVCILGATFLAIHALAMFRKKDSASSNSFWRIPERDKPDSEYFTSPY